MPRREGWGSLRRLPSGRWQVRYRGSDGLMRPGPRTFVTRAEARLSLRYAESDLARGQWLDHRLGEITLQEWSTRYMATTAALKPKTRADYASLLRTVILPRLGTRSVGSLRQVDVAEWTAQQTARGLSASRVRQAYHLLSQIMKAAALSGLIGATPCVAVRRPRLPEAEPTILTLAELSALIAAVDAGHRLLVATMAYTGVRWGEAAALRRRSVDLVRGRLTVAESLADVNGKQLFGETKTHQQRTVTLPRFLVEALATHLAGLGAGPATLLFTSPQGSPLRHSNFLRRTWQPAIKKAGLAGVTPHDLRATHASLLVDEGFSVIDVGARLGHARATVTTRHYARPVEGRDRRIADCLEALHQAEPGAASGATVARLWHDHESGTAPN